VTENRANEVGDEPCYIISVAAKLVGMHPQTLRYYERLNLVHPARSEGKIRLYSLRDVQRLQQIHRYVSDLGVNLAGVEVILRMTERMAEMERQMQLIEQELTAEIRRLRQSLGEPLEAEIVPPSSETTGRDDR
jgi:MerR family transcriptional regulator, heat shock protein HspR